jgi:outer membrane protein
MERNSHLMLALIFLSSLLIFPDVSAAGDSDKIRTLNLRECIGMAIRNDPDANFAMDQIKVGRLRTKEAKKALLLPRIDLETSYGPKVDFFGRPITDENIYWTRASIEKPLYKGGELMTTYRLGKRETRRAKYDYLQQVMGVQEDTIRDYYRLLSAQENLRYYQKLDGQAEKTVDLLNEEFRIGAVIRVDVLEAETEWNEIKYKLIKAQGDLQAAMSSLNERIGGDPGIRTQVVKEFPFQPLKGDIEKFIARALKNRPDLLYEKEDVEFNRLMVKLNKSKRLPSLSLRGSYGWEGDDFPGEDRDWSVMLTLSFSLHDTTLGSSVSQNRIFENPFNFVPETQDFDVRGVNLSVFDGSSNSVNLERARADYRQASNRLEQLKRAIVKEVRNAFNKIQESEATIQTTRKSIEYAGEKLKILEERLTLKEATELEVLEARVELVDAKVRNLQAQYERSVAVASLYKAIGRELECK